MSNKKLDDKKYNSTQEIINGAVALAASIVTGNVSGVITSVSPLLFALKARFLKPLQEEYTQMEENGLIKEDYYDTEQCKTGIMELLDAIENDLIDETIFDAMKKVFLVTSSEKVFDREDIEPLEFLRLCRKMSSGEILLLMANYNICKNSDDWKRESSLQPISDWVTRITKESALKLHGLIFLHEQGLMDKHLLKERSGASHVGIDKDSYRLTDLGFALCEYIEQYDSLLEDKRADEG